MNQVGKLIWLKNSLSRKKKLFFLFFFQFQPGIFTLDFAQHKQQ